MRQPTVEQHGRLSSDPSLTSYMGKKAQKWEITGWSVIKSCIKSNIIGFMVLNINEKYKQI